MVSLVKEENSSLFANMLLDTIICLEVTNTNAYTFDDLHENS